MFRGLSHMLYTTPKSKRLMAYHCNLDTINVVEHRSQGFHLRSMLLHLLHDCNVLKCLEGFEGWQCLNQNKCGRTTHMQHLRRDRCFMTSPSKMSRLVFWNSLPRYQNRKNIDPTATALGLISLGIFDSSIAKNTLALLAHCVWTLIWTAPK